MRYARPVSLVVSSMLGGAMVWMSTRTVPHALSIALGLAIVLVIPGHALVRAVIPEPQPLEHRLVASVGLSLIVTTCTVVFLAATSAGLSRESLGYALGGLTVGFSVCALARSLPTRREDEGSC